MAMRPSSADHPVIPTWGYVSVTPLWCAALHCRAMPADLVWEHGQKLGTGIYVHIFARGRWAIRGTTGREIGVKNGGTMPLLRRLRMDNALCCINWTMDFGPIVIIRTKYVWTLEFEHDLCV
ncbi:hypothetical protein BS78_01G246600 [Paspalum vaginatum]|nr:hypothetical protein BS78_01G246600 [Paspalum vaginatum]